MKLAWFNKLCDALWTGKTRGDVTAISLTDDSYQELLTDVVTAASLLATSHTQNPLMPGMPARAGLGEMVNPVTRSPVQVSGGADRDSVTVSYGNR